jgi:hypothetical protein
MRQFDPTRPPTGRLARLGVVIDPARADHPSIARFCDLAGIDVVWVGSSDGGPSPDRWTTSQVLAGLLQRAILGVVTDSAERPPEDLDAEFALARAQGADEFAATIDGSGRRATRISVAIDTFSEARPLLAVADDIVLPAWRFDDIETAADEIRAEAVETVRDPATLGIAALLPVSIGRTGAEAAARAEMDPDFVGRGHPRDIGIFGTLEECQDRVIALAHAGITDLRCVLPAVPDIHDVIAQLTAVTIGTTDVLIPGSLRSAAPPPPDGWGGRPDTPPRQRLSGGSRRR